MKVPVLVILIAAICTTACKKEIDTSSYYIRMTIDGNENLFSKNASAGEYSGDITAGFSMQADNDSSHSTFSLGVVHPFGVTLTEGEYNSRSDPYFPGSSYSKPDLFTYYGGHEGVSTVNLVVSNLTDKTVSGTFSGWYYSSMNPQDSIHVENGSFYLPVHPVIVR